MKTTLSDEIMNQMADIIEQKLKSSNTTYVRKETVFSVKSYEQYILLKYQLEAGEQLVKAGVITKEMLLADMKLFE